MKNLEIWKDIEDYEGHYQISEIGVKSLKRSKERILKPGIDSGGYPAVSLHNGIIKTAGGYKWKFKTI